MGKEAGLDREEERRENLEICVMGLARAFRLNGSLGDDVSAVFHPEEGAAQDERKSGSTGL